jgi:hypothetical protein
MAKVHSVDHFGFCPVGAQRLLPNGMQPTSQGGAADSERYAA